MASDTSSPSHTPLVLTPESTGSLPDATTAGAAGEDRKAKRKQTAFYPNNLSGPNKPPPKPFSRSAAKRQSVLALGSIEHLQYYFTKTGIQAQKNPHATKGFVPALGGLSINITSEDQAIPQVIQLPPTPVIPEPKAPAFPPYVKTYETDPASLLPGVIEDLAGVARVWRDTEDDVKFKEAKDPADILRLLKTTTRMIRSVRNYVLALPAEQFASSIPAAYRRMDSRHHQPTPPRSPANFADSSHQHTRDGSSGESEGQRRIRRAAVDTLTVLRDLEERSRVAKEDESEHGSPPQRSSSQTLDPYPGAPPSPTSLRTRSPSNPSSSPTPYSHATTSTYSVPVWSDDESDDGMWNLGSDDGVEKEGWDARLSRIEESGGFLYRSDIPLSELHKERDTVKAYLEVVDGTVFGGPSIDEGVNERGWERERRRTQDKERKQRSKQRRTSAGDAESRGRAFASASGSGTSSRRVSMPTRVLSDTNLSEEPLGEGEDGMENIQEEDEEEDGRHNSYRKGSVDDDDDDDLPEWAKRTAFMDNELERAHCLLSSLLPSDLGESLGSLSDGKEAFLDSLSSGQLLCVAYNAGVRRSKRPWGYVNREGIHDIIALESQGNEAEDRKKGWTFRRTENLRFWVGALGLRYILPISQPAQALPMAPTSSSIRASSIRPGRTSSPARLSRLSAGGGGSSGFSRGRSRSRGPDSTVVFDAKVVATKGEGWIGMLETVLGMWVGAVVSEERDSGRP